MSNRWRLTLLLLSMAAAGCARVRGSEPLVGPTSSPSPAESSPSTSPRRFIPPTEEEDDLVLIPITLPDGTRLTLSHPEGLGLAEMGLQPDVDLVWEGRWVGAVVFRFGGPEPRILAGGGPLATHESPTGSEVEEWTARRADGRLQNTTRWLVYRLAGWTVHIPLDHRASASEVLGAVTPAETPDGYVVLGVRSPGELPEGFGESGGPQVSFGDTDPRPDWVSTSEPDVLVQVAPSECGDGSARKVHGDYGSVCLADGQVFANAQTFGNAFEDRAFLKKLIQTLEVMDLQRP
jgi:hypothetical protein